ncbi:MAG TPA: M20 family metallopeptidase [Anaerolineales bacterium]|nr:M20 family metallopeptidase [Anaerolineales bacterium]
MKAPDVNFDNYLAPQQEPMKRALVELVSIQSVCDKQTPEYPFGQAIDQALRKALEIAGSLGFKAHYGDGGYYGWAEIGDGPEMLGILGHLDVVPAGQRADWKTDPFDPVEKDGMLYGRGTQDDKGPLVSSLFAVKALMDAGVKFNKRVRFIFGADEETLWRCINRYKEKEEAPSMGFSPDSRFPLIYAEKGLLQLKLEGENRTDIRMSGGSAFNAVPDAMFYDGVLEEELADQLDQRRFAYEWKDDGIEVKGKAVHAMIPEEGVNAIARLCIALCAVGVQSKAITFIAREIGEDPYATRIFGACSDEPSGKLKFNVGMIHLAEKEQISIDMRIPVTASKDELVGKLRAAAEAYGLQYKEFDWLPPLYVPRDHPVVATLMKAYREVSGDTVSEPIASGGATYARAFGSCVAFGPLFPGEPVTEHEPNERAVLDNLYRAMKIYANAVYALTR